MTDLINSSSYVKFSRGTPERWELMKEYANPDTMYFIAEPQAKQGKLYLGKKLISDGSIDIVNNLSQVLDAIKGEGLNTESLLVFNPETNLWELQPLEIILANANLKVDVMVGATVSTDGKAGLVPAPKQSEYKKFLCGDGIWREVKNNLYWIEF